MHIAAIGGVGLLDDVFDHTAAPIFDDKARAVSAFELVFEVQLHTFCAHNAFNALAFKLAAAHHLGGRFTGRVLALVLAHLVQAFDFQGLNLRGNADVDTTAQPHKGALAGHLVVKLLGLHAQQLAERLALCRVGAEVFGVDPQRWRGHRGRQQQTVAVKNAAPAGG